MDRCKCSLTQETRAARRTALCTGCSVHAHPIRSRLFLGLCLCATEVCEPTSVTSLRLRPPPDLPLSCCPRNSRCFLAVQNSPAMARAASECRCLDVRSRSDAGTRSSANREKQTGLQLGVDVDVQIARRLFRCASGPCIESSPDRQEHADRNRSTSLTSQMLDRTKTASSLSLSASSPWLQQLDLIPLGSRFSMPWTIFKDGA